MLNSYVVKFGDNYYDMRSDLKCQVTSDYNFAQKFSTADAARTYMRTVECEISEDQWRVVRCEAVVVEYEVQQ